MRSLFHTLRFKLLFWYTTSLAFLGIFIILTVHILQYKYSTQLIITLFFLLAIFGFMVVYKITQSIKSLSTQIRHISSKNLDKRINTIQGKDEIGQLAQSFNELRDRLDKAFKRERQFIADVAHEMKTPIATLRSGFEVTLHKERTNEEYKKIINSQKGTRGMVPPGIYADYGFVLIQTNRVEEGKLMLQKEIELYPESKIFIKKIYAMLE